MHLEPADVEDHQGSVEGSVGLSKVCFLTEDLGFSACLGFDPKPETPKP